MKIKQFRGPFLDNKINLSSLGSNVKIIQLGVECPQCIPLSERINNQQLIDKIVYTTDDKTYTIGDKDILEFENLYIDAANIFINSEFNNNPYLIVDIAYE